MVLGASVRQSTAAPNGTATAPTGTPPPGADLLAELPVEVGFEQRLMLTVALAGLVLVFARFVAPKAIDWGNAVYRAKLPSERIDPWLSAIDDTIPFGLTTYYVVRTIQGVFVGAAVLLLLVIWGWTGVAIDAVLFLVNSADRIVRIVFSVALIVGAYVAVGLLEDFVDRIASNSDRFDEHQGEIVFRVLQVVLLASAGLVILTIWEVNLGGLLVGAGFLGIVVGMAARQTLGSLLAGFVLMFSKPFEVGDWVEVNDQEGVVTDITIVNTRLENFDGEYVVMPNDVISNSTIINRTRKGRLRVRLEVGVDYDVDPEHAAEVGKDAIKDVDEVMSVPRPQVVPTGFGDSAILLEARFWIDKPSSRRRWRAKAAVIEAIYDAYEEADIGIPFPQRVVSSRAADDAFRVARQGANEPEAPSEPAED